MDGAETVVRAAERGVELGVAAIVVAAGRPELEQAASTHGRRQLGGVRVVLWMLGELDSDGPAGLVAGETLVPACALVVQRGVRSDDRLVGCARGGGEERRGDAVRLAAVDVPGRH